MDLRPNGVANPTGEAGLPFIETGGDGRFGLEIAALGERGFERRRRGPDNGDLRGDGSEELLASSASVETPELFGLVVPGEAEEALENSAVHEIGERREPIESCGGRKMVEYPGAGALVERAKGFDARRG